MLRWRLIIGTILVVLLLGLCWLDVHGPRPGVYLLPLAIVLCVLATEELLAIFRAVAVDSHKWAVRAGTLVTLLSASVPLSWSEGAENPSTGRLGCLAIGLVVSLALIFLAEMCRYVAPGKAIVQIAAGSLAIIYLGGLLGFLVQLRLVSVGGEYNSGGMLALFSMIAVVKFTDIGAYFAGHRFGRRKLAATISPGKTWEGAAGGLVLGVLAGMVVLGPLAQKMGVPSERGWFAWLGGVIVYGIIVSIAGMLGDLAESLLKRDAGVKDSSTWLPGFGGVLDMIDSLLLAAPAAYLLWIGGLVG